MAKCPCHPALEEIRLENVLHALSDPVRLNIVQDLAAVGDEERACISFAVSVAKSTMSHHVRVLRETGLIRVRPDGARSLLSLRRADIDTRLPGLLDVVLKLSNTTSDK